MPKLARSKAQVLAERPKTESELHLERISPEIFRRNSTGIATMRHHRIWLIDEIPGQPRLAGDWPGATQMTGAGRKRNGWSGLSNRDKQSLKIVDGRYPSFSGPR
jgi:hypothetical protein